jgi:hypothetical protein
MSHPEVDENREGTAYTEGLRAFESGCEESDCPYSTSQGGGTGRDRVRWFTGYFDRRVQVKFRDLFSRFGMTHP